MPQIVVFAGAGASKAVNASGYPTTVEFFQRLPRDISEHTIFGLATEYLHTRSEKRGAIDIEEILWALQELDAFLGAVTDTNSVPGWFLRSDRLFRVLGVSANNGSLLDHTPEVRKIVTTIVSKINALVYDFYSRMPEQFEMEANWLPLIEGLLTSGASVELFTTNYDIVIEAALENLESRGKVPIKRIVTGRHPGLRPLLDQLLWARRAEDRQAPAGLLTKLHGSVDWSRGPEGTYVGDPLFKGDHNKHVILYPGFKGLPAAEPFAAFHNYFANVIAKADYILFIGFAFRDQYINDLLKRFTAIHAKILVIDPATELPNIPFPSGRVMHLSNPFDLESVSLTLNTLTQSSLKHHL
jgi:hypothetical protein